MTEELDWRGEPMPDINEIRVNLERLRGERAVTREKLRAVIERGLAEMRDIANDPPLRAAAAGLSRITGQPVDEIVMASIQPAIDEYEARLVAHDANTEYEAPAEAGEKPGAVTLAFLNKLNGGSK